MSIFHLFGKRAKEQPPQKSGQENDREELGIYSGMRVEVTTPEGVLLFVAKLEGLHGREGELHQYSETELPQMEPPFRVKLRGYSDADRKAVSMEGAITPMPRHIWKVEELSVARVGNDRAFFRLDTDVEATATMFSGLAMGEKPCRLLDISVGGGRISSEYRYHTGDKFLLKVRLIEDLPESVMFCQVLRVIARDKQKYEYGCEFLELTEDDRERIMQNIFTVQRQKSKRT